MNINTSHSIQPDGATMGRHKMAHVTRCQIWLKFIKMKVRMGPNVLPKCNYMTISR